MSNREKAPLVPKLRFPEFEQSWDKIPLGKLGQFFRGLTYGADDVTSEGLLVLRSSNIQGGQLILDSDLVFVKKQCPPELRLKRGDIAICMSNGSKALVGKSGELDRDYPSELTVGAFCSIFRPTSPFAKIAFSTPRYEGFVATGIAGGNINNLKNSDLEAFEFHVPPSHVEQQKIADCLSSLDELIGAQARKVGALKTHKKWLMQELFPSEGETQPRLRFPNCRDKGKWQKQKISALLTKSVSPVDVDSGTAYKEIGIRSHGKGIFHKDLIDGKALGEKRVFWVTDDALILNIVFAWEQALAVTSPAEKGMIASHRFPMYTARTGKANVKFIKYFFLSWKGKDLLGIASPGGAGRNKTLGQKEFENLEFLAPSNVEEQKEIADILSSIDTLIASQSRKLETLKTHKKGLMQQLFPMAEAVEA